MDEPTATEAPEAAPEPPPYEPPEHHYVIDRPEDADSGWGCNVQTTDAFGGPVDETFEPGAHEPKSERQEAALDHLAQLGYARVVPGRKPGPKAATEKVTKG